MELSEIFVMNMMPTFDTKGDEMLYRGWARGYRPKLIHSVGTVGKVKFVPKDTKFDGPF
mgnify:CR=1 FL=1